MEVAIFDFNEFVKGIREGKPSHVVPLLDYLSNEYSKSIIARMEEIGVEPGEKYFFDKKRAEKFGINELFRGLTYLSSEKSFEDMDYRPLKINGMYYSIWLALNVHDCTDSKEPCVLVNGNIIYHAEKVYNYFMQEPKTSK